MICSAVERLAAMPEHEEVAAIKETLAELKAAGVPVAKTKLASMVRKERKLLGQAARHEQRRQKREGEPLTEEALAKVREGLSRTAAALVSGEPAPPCPFEEQGAFCVVRERYEDKGRRQVLSSAAFTDW